MFKNIIGFLSVFLVSIMVFVSIEKSNIVISTDETPNIVSNSSIKELRDESVYRWLSGSFRIENSGADSSIFGSGTLCYYDKQTNTGYIISCGHLFNGNEKTMFIDTWYKNGIKLSSPARYIANVIGYSPTEDIAFFSFTPDWIPNEYFPIAPVDKKIDDYLWSVGCDGGREVAVYKVKYVEIKGIDSDRFLITRENSPRHGRSGGGLMTSDGFYVGICVRSSDPTGSTNAGIGLFVPLNRIHNYCNSNNLGFLLGLQPANSLLLSIPIIDRNNIQNNYPKNYVPRP